MTRIYMHEKPCKEKNGKTCYVKAAINKQFIMGFCSVCGTIVEKYYRNESQRPRQIDGRTKFGRF